jgi:hypothetical protein
MSWCILLLQGAVSFGSGQVLQQQRRRGSSLSSSAAPPASLPDNGLQGVGVAWPDSRLTDVDGWLDEGLLEGAAGPDEEQQQQQQQSQQQAATGAAVAAAVERAPTAALSRRQRGSATP